MEDPRWMVLPWVREEKGVFQSFIDFVAEGSGLLECADVLEAARPVNPDDRPFNEAAGQLLVSYLDLVRRMKGWLLSTGLMLAHGPPIFTLGSGDLARASAERTKLRGYSKKFPVFTDTSFEDLQDARLMHIYWTVLLDLYMSILGNSGMCRRLGPQLGYDFASSEIAMRAECRRLADDISIYGEFCCQNIWQSFGPMSKCRGYCSLGLLPNRLSYISGRLSHYTCHQFIHQMLTRYSQWEHGAFRQHCSGIRPTGSMIPTATCMSHIVSPY